MSKSPFRPLKRILDHSRVHFTAKSAQALLRSRNLPFGLRHEIRGRSASYNSEMGIFQGF